MFRTKNDLPESTRTQVIETLNLRLADAVALQTQAKQAHWNVKGPHFIGLHELFDDVSDAVLEYTDLIAERVVQLGGVAEGTAGGIHSAFDNTQRVVRSWREEKTADGRMILIPENFLVDRNGEVIRKLP